MRLSLIVVGLSLWLVSRVPLAHAAGQPSIEFIPPVGIIHADDLIPIEVNIDSGGAVMNAVDVTISYPTTIRVERIQREQTAFPLWPEAPTINTAGGTVHLVAGRPGGLVAIHARVATLYVSVLQPGTFSIGLNSSTSGMYMNDGAGSKAVLGPTTTTFTVRDQLYQGLTIESSSHADQEHWSKVATVVIHWDTAPNTVYSYQLTTDPQATPDTVPETTNGDVTYPDLLDGRYIFTIRSKTGNGPWSEVSERRFLIDATRPEAFTILAPNPADTSNQAVITWTAVDVMSGVDQTTARIGNHDVGAVQSPLHLEPNWRGKIITVTVTDQAGNQRTSQWAYRQSGDPTGDQWLLILTGVVLFGGGLTWWIIRRR
jgi:hypothetical protein